MGGREAEQMSMTGNCCQNSCLIGRLIHRAIFPGLETAIFDIVFTKEIKRYPLENRSPTVERGKRGGRGITMRIIGWLLCLLVRRPGTSDWFENNFKGGRRESTRDERNFPFLDSFLFDSKTRRRESFKNRLSNQERGWFRLRAPCPIPSTGWLLPLLIWCIATWKHFSRYSKYPVPRNPRN